jgi:hypothetical protein
MTGYDPAEALAEIERTQQKAYAEQRMPLWYAPGFAMVMTVGQIGLDSENLVVNALCALASAAGIGALFALLVRRSRVRWASSSWSLPAVLVYLGWALLGVAAAFGVHALADALDQPWRKLAAGAVAAVLLLATTRPMENLVLHYSKGRVAK